MLSLNSGILLISQQISLPCCYSISSPHHTFILKHIWLVLWAKFCPPPTPTKDIEALTSSTSESDRI